MENYIPSAMCNNPVTIRRGLSERDAHATAKSLDKTTHYTHQIKRVGHAWDVVRFN